MREFPVFIATRHSMGGKLSHENDDQNAQQERNININNQVQPCFGDASEPGSLKTLLVQQNNDDISHKANKENQDDASYEHKQKLFPKELSKASRGSLSLFTNENHFINSMSHAQLPTQEVEIEVSLSNLKLDCKEKKVITADEMNYDVASNDISSVTAATSFRTKSLRHKKGNKAMQLLHLFYTKKYKIQPGNDDYIVWDNGAADHVLKFTCIFVCPNTKGWFHSGQHGSEESYTVGQDQFVWYNREIYAKQAAAAARALDCLILRTDNEIILRRVEELPYTAGEGPDFSTMCIPGPILKPLNSRSL